MDNHAIQAPTLSLHTLRAWLIAVTLTVGNILMPQICHLMPQGGLIFLPIYFFTLIATMVYGWRVGIVVAIASPIVNSALFGMPATQMLPIILTKGVLLVLAAGAARKISGISLCTVAAAVIAYQGAGCLIESLMASSLSVGFQDLRLGMPGIILQVTAGYLLINSLTKSHC